MSRTEAMGQVNLIRAEVVALVGICGRGTHPLTELLQSLQRGDKDPDEAVAEAQAIRESVTDFR